MTTVKDYPVFRHRDDETGCPTSVYRIFDKHDRLLYIGVARDVNHRIYMHLATWTMADAAIIHANYARHESVEYTTRAKARKVERAAIASEMPWLNRQHNPKRWRRVNGQYQPVDPGAYEALYAGYVAERESERAAQMAELRKDPKASAAFDRLMASIASPTASP